MDLGSLLLLLALLLLAALFVARPLLYGGQEAAMEDGLDGLLAERERILDAIAELDADWELGKMLEDAYRSQRQQLVAEGAEILRQLEAAATQEEKAVQPSKSKSQVSDERLEAMIAAYKKKARK